MGTLLDERLSVLFRGSRRVPSLSDLIEGWEHLVEQCEEGYGWNADELANDFSCRHGIEIVTRDPVIRDHPAVRQVAGEAEELDRRFRRLLQEGIQVGSPALPWWERGVLRYAGDEYADDMKTWHGVEVERRN